MNKILNGVIAASLVAVTAISSIAPVEAQSISFGFGQRDRVIQSYCDRNPRDPDCRRYRGGGWSDRDYNRFYSRRRGDLDNIATGLFGFTFGAIVGGAIANSRNNAQQAQGGDAWWSHVERCEARYRSYDQQSDTFLGYDGVRHACRL